MKKVYKTFVIGNIKENVCLNPRKQPIIFFYLLFDYVNYIFLLKHTFSNKKLPRNRNLKFFSELLLVQRSKIIIIQ